MSAAVTIILGIHYHLPNGADDSAFERLYSDKIRPALSTLYKFPKIPAVLHFSGSLWYWIERNHSEIFMLTADMVRRKQLELLTGGFYEPVMPLISYKDRLGHIEMLTTYLRKHFGKRTQGCLLPKLAWDSSMPSVLTLCNITYTFLDETYFFDAGIKESGLYEPYISEDKGKFVTIFPIPTGFNAMLEQNVPGTLDSFLLDAKNNGAEKIVSVFPPCFNNRNPEPLTETSAHYFLSDLSEYENKIDFSLPSKLIKNLVSRRKIYFSQKAVKKCLIEYPEKNYLYAKMTFVRALIDQLRGDKISKRSAYEELWKAQNHDLFCGAPQSGINQASIRNAAYHALLDAEKITREYKAFLSSLIVFDFNFDGVNEYLFQSEDINCFISETGASIFELDYLPRSWNYCGAASVDGKRYSFSDMIAPPGFSYKSVINKDYSGARLCGEERYEMTAIDRQRHKLSFKLPALDDSNFLNNFSNTFSNMEIEKSYNFKNDEISVSYCITNKSNTKQEFIFIPELNISFSNDDETRLRVYSYNEYESFSNHSEKMIAPPLEGGGLTISDAAAIDFQDMDNEVIINLSADALGADAPGTDAGKFNAWILSESSGLDAVSGIDYYQSSRVLIHKRLCLAGGSGSILKFKLSFYH
ncbi:MAG: DUF1926 domain-containing protein [Spirochaetaceae bacterium]|jgi:predicted DNA-binding protein YlxM (UPF0122 family)|nr:DUF1926 domain-containing protein [Spirochaetaceae bacterium]